MYESLINSLLARYQITPIELFDRLAHAKLSKLKEDVFLRSDKCPKEMYLKYKDYIANSISSPCSTEEDIILYYNKINIIIFLIILIKYNYMTYSF